MAAASLPIKFAELVNLTKLGINPAHIKFKNVTLQSSKYVTIKEEGQNTIAVVDTATKKVQKHNPKAVDSAIMHPTTKVIGFRAGVNLQIYNIEMATKLKWTKAKEPVVFWKWLDAKTVVYVTQSSVYHWSMDSQFPEPQKAFDRAKAAGNVQITNYRRSVDKKWLMLGGVTASANGGIAGLLQLYSVEHKVSQKPLDSTAGCFGNVTLDGKSSPSTLFCFIANTGQNGYRMSVIELSAPRESAFKASMPVQFPQQNDFALSMQCDDKHGTIFMLTKAGYLFLFDVHSCKMIFGKKVSQATMFASVPFTNTSNENDGIMTVDQSGRVIVIGINEDNVVSYITDEMKDPQLGVKYAARYGLPGAENIFKQQFKKLVQMQNVDGAVKCASEAPGNALRTKETIQMFMSLQGQPPPVFKYFSALLRKGKLTDFESVSLARIIVQSNADAGRKKLTEWISKDLLTFSEELGDTLRPFDVKLACAVYLRGNNPEKAIGCFLQLGEFQRIIDFANKVNFEPDYNLLISQLHRINREKSTEFAIMLINNEEQSKKVNVENVIQIFMQSNDVESTTSFLLDVLKKRGDREEDAQLQTKLLEINLMNSPRVVDAILDSDEFKMTHFDKARIASLCERVRHYSRALTFFENVEDKKRVLLVGLNQGLISPDFILNYFGDLDKDDALFCLRSLLEFNNQQHLGLVVEIAKRYSQQMTPKALLEIFDSIPSPHGVFYYLGSFVNFTQDSSLVFRYIQAASKVPNVREIERICRDHDYYDAIQVKEFLLDLNLKDPRPLIHVCDRHDFIEELTRFLFQSGKYAFIQTYVQKLNHGAAPEVVATLLDLSCEDSKIRELLAPVRPPECNIQKLVSEVSKRNRLRLLSNWLEARKHEGLEDVHLHNALGMLYVETGNNPQQFLINNKFYDSKVVGEFCESRDPRLAFMAYKRSWGKCDAELLRVSNVNGFFKDQARYLVERKDEQLWKVALDEKNEHRRSLIDQIVATALPESRDPNEVSCTVRAFLDAEINSELIELLEKIVLHGPPDSEFVKSQNLQNLLLLTAIKSDTKRVMDYANRLNNYAGNDIATVATSYGLHEEAFFIFSKVGEGESAIKILLNELNDLQRADDYARYLNQKPVWSLLGRAYLHYDPSKAPKTVETKEEDADGDDVKEENKVDDGILGGIVDKDVFKEYTSKAIDALLKAEDIEICDEVIMAANRDDLCKELIPYLIMAREKKRHQMIDNELLYAYGKTNNLGEMEAFITSPNSAKVEAIGDRFFDETLFEAAKILFLHVKNFSKLALCYVMLGQYQMAVDAARQAKTIPTWKAVCYACVDAEEFKLAQSCGTNIIVYLEHLKDLVTHYEQQGYFSEVIALLEQGMNLERTHNGIFTELGVLYAKYKEDKLMEHIKLFRQRLNIPTVLKECKNNYHWNEVVFLQEHFGQFESACDTMMKYTSVCWTHEKYKANLLKVANSQIYYDSINYYLDTHPLLLTDLLIELSPKLDHTRATSQIKNSGHLPLVKKYLLFVQSNDLQCVNDAINQIFIDELDYKSLRTSILNHSNFDHILLAQKLEKHEFLEFRRISALLFKTKKRWKESIALSEKDNMFGDVIQTAAESEDSEVAEGILRYFVEKKQNACFAASLYACFNHLKPDVAMELAWRNNLTDIAMPYMIQTLRDYDDRMREMEMRWQKQDQAKKDAEQTKKEEEEKQNEMMMQGGVPIGMGGLNAPLQIASSAYNAPAYGMGGMGAGMGGMQGGMQGGMGGMQGGMQGGMGGMQGGMGGMQGGFGAPQNGFNNNTFQGM